MSCNPCEPACDPCNKCGKPRRYVQPPRTQIMRPTQLLRFPGTGSKMDASTVYKESFQCIDSDTIKYCRSAPIRPTCLLRTNPEMMDKETVTKLSFPAYCNYERRKPIIPNAPSLLGEGPMQTLTTQKHDFVCKIMPKTRCIPPREHFSKTTAPIEKMTTQKLSFMPPCGFDRARSYKPSYAYELPQIPMERDTVHRLSFIPMCPPPKERLPWAERGTFFKPCVPMDTITTNKLSYMPPGCFVDDGSCCCCPMVSNECCAPAPTAAIC